MRDKTRTYILLGISFLVLLLMVHPCMERECDGKCDCGCGQVFANDGAQVAVVLDPRAKTRGMGCIANVKKISSAMELYHADHGKYPASLKEISPKYLNKFPVCPAAGKDTYSSTYRASKDGKNYEFYCKGKNHLAGGLPEDHPRFDSKQGVIEK